MTEAEIPTVTAADIEQAIAKVKANHATDRVIRLDIQGAIYWMKQSETHETLQKRLKKGGGDKALKREVENLRFSMSENVPVPELVTFGESYLVIEDCGMTLADLFASSEYDPKDGLRIFHAAGYALARLHASGLALGRTKPKDFCWDGVKIRFIDLEVSLDKIAPQGNGRYNLYRFVFNAFYDGYHVRRDATAEVKAFLDGYASHGGPVVSECLIAARKWARRRWWQAALTLPFGFLRPIGRSPDFKAMAPALITLAYRAEDETT